MKCPKCQFENPADTHFCGNCAAPLSSALDMGSSKTMTIQQHQKFLSKGSILAGKYRIVEPIGKGGMGVVYKAEDIKLDRTVALKFLPAELSEDSEARERFVREAKAAAALSHAHICTIHEIGEEENQYFIAMECIKGQSLKQKIQKGPLDQTEALAVAIQVAEGLEEAHKNGIIHRDIKPGNIMLTDNGTAKVMDFGLAKVLGGSLITKEAKTMGTVAYMSPEQARGEPVDQRTDIWSLGVVFYEMLSGELPFRGDQEASILYSVVHGEPDPFQELRPPIPSELQQIIFRALKKKPESRYQSAGEMLSELKAYRDVLKAEAAGVWNFRMLVRRLRRPRVAIPVFLGLVALALLLFWHFDRQAKIRWAEEVALPELETLIDIAPPMNDYRKTVRAYDLAVRAERYIADNPELQKLLPMCAVSPSVITEPPGARIYIQEYVFPDHEWRLLGISPLKGPRLPYVYYRWRIEKEGYETVFLVSDPCHSLPPDKEPKDWGLEMTLILKKEGTVPAGMVRIPPVLTDAGSAADPAALGDFFVDRHEVTNRQFKEFVRDGGYQDPRYWRHEFVKDGKILGWEEATALFVDRTNRPGPATWEGGAFPEGQADFPVFGVSWYEAAAFAEYAGKSLPTADHWSAATGMDWGNKLGAFYIFLVARSNLKGSGPMAVGTNQAANIFGTFDMAGNVREWCSNDTEKGKCLRGAAFGDPDYMFSAISQAPPFDRSLRNGFRCAIYIDPEKIPPKAWAAVEAEEYRDYLKESPASDEVFKVLKAQFSYDRMDLKAVAETRDDGPGDWVKEKVVFDAAYGGERMAAYLYLPKNAQPPFQTVIFFPGGAGLDGDSAAMMDKGQFRIVDFIPKNGRALVFPVYRGTFERGTEGDSFGPRQYIDDTVKLVNDCRRTIDYLETRPDIDMTKLAYLGLSWGARMGILIPAVEDRIQVIIDISGGLDKNAKDRRPYEIDQVHYLPRITVPTLMLNGRYDLLFPPEASVEPVFKLLGTPDKDKRLMLFDTDHWIPREDVIRETLSWLDTYLGPVMPAKSGMET